MDNFKCKICQKATKCIFETDVLNRYKAKYFKCLNCGFIQTEKPYWLEEAYKSAITDLDLGLISRNIFFSEIINKIILNTFSHNSKFLDYAGGYGIFTRLMRDKGLNFYREDKYCTNLFAKTFDVKDLKEKQKFELVTAFEVFEHFENPIKDIKKIFKYSDSIIFSTELQPEIEISNEHDWWYFTPETGQHVSFYTLKSLELLARKYGYNFYSNSSNLHLFSKHKFIDNPLINFDSNKSTELPKLETLLQRDFNFIKKLKNLDIDSLPDEQRKKIIGHFRENDEKEFATKPNIKEVAAPMETEPKIMTSTTFIKNEIKQTLVLLRYHLRLSFISKKNIKQLTDTLKFNICNFGNNILQSIIKKKSLNKKINFSSKKIVYIGHSYHKKTESTKFLLDYLRDNFEVIEIIDESWLGKPFPNLDFINESYLGILFFQNFPQSEIIMKIKNNNLIFFPMYDSGGVMNYNYWKKYEGVRYINFSRTLHEQLKKWGFDSIYVQYFPKPNKFSFGDKNSIFFWQRLTRVSINTLDLLFNKSSKLHLHIHKVPDPGQILSEPSNDQLNRFKITTSEWFKKRNMLWKIINKSAVFFAPREYEGIGMSYLEAMANGRAVVAINNPTMNEYIIDGKTGYLFDLANPKPINFDNIQDVQKSAHNFITKGYRDWIKQKQNIIDFIKHKHI